MSTSRFDVHVRRVEDLQYADSARLSALLE
jgi:hypothetical protein